MVKIGDIVYDAGNYWSAASPVRVCNDNIFIITKYWNRLYFNTMDEAQHKNNILHAEYGEYQASAWDFY